MCFYALKDDELSFTFLLHNLADELLSYARWRCYLYDLDQGIAEDIVQEACRRVVQYKNNYDHTWPVISFFRRSIIDAATDVVRKEGGRPFPPRQWRTRDGEEDAGYPSYLDRPAPVRDGPEYLAMQNERLQWLANAMLALSITHREAFRLRFEGLTFQEIADALGCAASTAYTYVEEACTRLQEQWRLAGNDV